MRLYTRLAAVFIAALFVFMQATSFAATPKDYSVLTPENLETGHLYGTAAVLMDGETGRVLFEKSARERRYPASTTKIMTCIVALEEGPVGEKVTIPAGIEPPSGSSKLGISTGEVMNFDDLLYGMMMSSGNDAAIAIAILTSGTERKFVNRMNEMALDLGLTGTHFENSHGYHTVNHYTTAYDLAVITRYAMQNDDFREIAACTMYEMAPTNFRTARQLTTKYDLLVEGKSLYYEPCIGVKTGYTNAAGRCFVGAGETNGQMLISVTLGTDSEDTAYSQAFTDTIRLLKYGFLQYESLSFNDLYALCEDTLLSFRVDKAHPDDPNNGYLRMTVTDIPDSYREWFLKSDLQDVKYLAELVRSFTGRIEATFDSELVAPITKGDVLGKARFTTLEGVEYKGCLVASRDVERKEPTMDEVLDEWIVSSAQWMFKLMPRHNPPVKYAYWGLLILIIALIVWRTHVRRIKERARREELRRKLLYQKQLQKKRKAVEAARKGMSSKPQPRPQASVRTGTSARSAPATRSSAASRPAAPVRAGNARPAAAERKTVSSGKSSAVRTGAGTNTRNLFNSSAARKK